MMSWPCGCCLWASGAKMILELCSESCRIAVILRQGAKDYDVVRYKDRKKAGVKP